MDALQKHRRERLKAAAERAGSNVALARLLGYKDGAFVGQMLRGDRPVTEDTVLKLEAKPGFKGWFLQGAPYPIGGSVAEPVKVSENIGHGDDRHEYAVPYYTQGMANVMATAKVGADGFFEEEMFKGLAGGFVPDLGHEVSYALKIRGDGMSPVIESGSFVLVSQVEAEPGEKVVVRLADDRQAIRKLLYVRDGMVYVMPVQGGATQTFDMNDVDAIHPIVAVIEPRSWRAAQVGTPRRALPKPSRGGNLPDVGTGEQGEGSP